MFAYGGDSPVLHVTAINVFVLGLEKTYCFLKAYVHKIL